MAKSMFLSNDPIDFDGVQFTRDEIFSVVDGFYSQVANHKSLKAPFSSVENWSKHIDHMTHFWWIRLGGVRYLETKYSPVAKHFLAGFNQSFLEDWLLLFEQTLKESSLSQQQASTWFQLACRMGQYLSKRNESLWAAKKFEEKSTENSSSQSMPVLPEGFKAYKKTPIFTAETVPKGLLKNHKTKKEVWGVIHIVKGALEYTIETSSPVVHILTVSKCGIIEQEQLHRVKPIGEVEFYIEFHKREG